ncbi:encapsulin [Oxyplasma meridianum]|uniref:Encapsulin n=1 Tax=Oxyplasma meridianum TaxID=3073602 RepID=A0AAX4NGG8_9ARCH
MFSKDPSELVRTKTFDNEEISRSIRLDLAAELDAINFYLQQSKLMPEGSFKKVHEDIAKEEITHFGEFLRLMHEYAPEDFVKIREGWKEASELLGQQKEFPMYVGKKELQVSREGVEPDSKTFSHHYITYVEEIKWSQDGLPLPEDNQKIIPLSQVIIQYNVHRHTDSQYKKMEEEMALRKFDAAVNKLIMADHELSLLNRATDIKSGDWSKSGNLAKDIIKAIEFLSDSGYVERPELLISSSAYELLVREVESTGQTEMEMVRKLLEEIHVTSLLKENQFLALAKGSFKLFIKTFPEIRRISEDVLSDQYVIYSKFAPMLFDRKSAVRITWKPK